MNYIGSKLSLLKFIDNSINEVTGGNFSSICDPFAGTGAVGKFYKEKGKNVISNDIQFYSYVLNRNYIGTCECLNFAGLYDVIPNLKDTENKYTCICKYLSSLQGIEGFIYKNYCLSGSGERMYFSDQNGLLCDAIRNKIDEWRASKKITENEYYFLLCSLLESIDKVANTASVYGAFLKNLKKSAQKKLEVKPALPIVGNGKYTVYNADANTVAKENIVDVLYLDPPYNQRQYATNYHILETIAKNDTPEIHGKTGLRNYENQKSAYCSKGAVKQAFQELIVNAKAKYIFLSYNNEGLMSPDEIKDIMGLRGKYGCYSQRYHRFKADATRSYAANGTTEYLHYVVCDDAVQ